MKCIWQSFPIFRVWTQEISSIKPKFVWSYVTSKIPTIAAPGRSMTSCLYCCSVSNNTSQLVLKLKKTVTEFHSLLVGLLWTFRSNILNLSAAWTSFQTEVWSPPFQWTFMSNVSHPNYCLHVAYRTQSSQKRSNHQFTTFIRYFCSFI